MKRVGLLLGMLVTGVGMAVAGPEGPPEADVLRELIAEEAKVLEKTVTIAVILPGKVTSADGFQADDAVRVVYLWNGLKKEDARRVMAEKIFYWNEEYGWFTYARGELRGYEVVDIFSEEKGLIRLR